MFGKKIILLLQWPSYTLVLMVYWFVNKYPHCLQRLTFWTFLAICGVRVSIHEYMAIECKDKVCFEGNLRWLSIMKWFPSKQTLSLSSQSNSIYSWVETLTQNIAKIAKNLQKVNLCGQTDRNRWRFVFELSWQQRWAVKC